MKFGLTDGLLFAGSEGLEKWGILKKKEKKKSVQITDNLLEVTQSCYWAV